jgi:hypothetical protein
MTFTGTAKMMVAGGARSAVHSEHRGDRVELRIFAAFRGGSLDLYCSHEKPASASEADWLPAPAIRSVMFSNLNKYWRSISFESLHDGVGIVETSTFYARSFIERNPFVPRHANCYVPQMQRRIRISSKSPTTH